MGYGEAAPGAMLAIAPAVLSPSGQRRTLNEPLRTTLQESLGTVRSACSRAVHPTGGLRIMCGVTWLQSGARWRHQTCPRRQQHPHAGSYQCRVRVDLEPQRVRSARPTSPTGYRHPAALQTRKLGSGATLAFTSIAGPWSPLGLGPAKPRAAELRGACCPEPLRDLLCCN